MSTTRRRFLHLSLATGAGLASGILPRALAFQPPADAKKLRILILGGTGFLGPACTESALARGHHVTHFNRGRTESRRKQAGRPSAVPEGVETLYGNRDPNKASDDGSPAKEGEAPGPKGLSQLEGKKWDAVIDTSGYFPRMVKASAALLAPNVSHYLFVSTVSVYASNDKPGADESADLALLEDPDTESFGAQFENYGAGKAACEKAAEAAMPGRVTSVRPGFIVGPRDTSRRFMYWPVRCARGGAMAVPGNPEDPIQVVDVRDLADFIVLCLERRTIGAFNVTGPAAPLSMRDFVAGCNKGVAGSAQPHWLDPHFIETYASEKGLADKLQFPLYVPPSGDTAGFHTRSIRRALDAGLTFRPLDDTAKATYEWYKSLPENLQQAMIPPMLTQSEEDALIAAAEKK